MGVIFHYSISFPNIVSLIVNHIKMLSILHHRIWLNWTEHPCFYALCKHTENFKFYFLRMFRCLSLIHAKWRASVQFSSVAQLYPTLCDPMNRSTPCLPVHHQLWGSIQTNVHRVGDAIQPSHPLSSPSPPALNLSQHQGLFKQVNSQHQVAKVLEFQL